MSADSPIAVLFNTVTASESGTNTNPVSVQPRSSDSATLNNIPSSASNVTLFASNINRKMIFIFNDSTKTLYVKFGATASLTSCTVPIDPKGYWEHPPGHIYSGIVDGIWSSANGSARVTELT